MRRLVSALVLAFALAACGKYGPPVRTVEPRPKAAPVTNDPNAPAPASPAQQPAPTPAPAPQVQP